MIYKWTDADGVVHYSDQPVPGAEKIVTSSPTNNGIGGAVTATPQSQSPPKSAALAYTQFFIESPAKEQVFFNDELIPIRLMLEPALKPNQTISWHLNGKELDDQPPSAVSFTLQSLARGTYVLAATITDSVTGGVEDLGQRDLLHATALRARQPAPDALISTARADAPLGR